MIGATGKAVGIRKMGEVEAQDRLRTLLRVLPHHTDPSVLARLTRAEGMIQKIDERQQKTEKSLDSIQSYMSQRFEQVLEGLAALQEPSRRKARTEEGDARGGRQIKCLATNITSWRQH